MLSLRQTIWKQAKKLQFFSKMRKQRKNKLLWISNFKSAFDTIWRKLSSKGLSKFISSKKCAGSLDVCYKNWAVWSPYIYNNIKCSVLIDENLTYRFHVEVRVRQDCILWPTLFNILLEFVIDDLTSLTCIF